LPGSLHFGIESQAVLEKWNSAFKRRARFWTREIVIHIAHLSKISQSQFGTGPMKKRSKSNVHGLGPAPFMTLVFVPIERRIQVRRQLTLA